MLGLTCQLFLADKNCLKKGKEGMLTDEKHKEKRGNKTRIKMIFQRVRDIRPSGYANLNKKLHKTWKKCRPFVKGVYWVDVKNIDTRFKLCLKVRQLVGYGVFNVLFHSRYVKSKKFRPNFICLKDKCHFLQKGKCNNKRFYRIWKHDNGYLGGQKVKGWSCRKNPKYHPNFVKRCRVKIVHKIDFESEIDFDYVWFSNHDKMYYFNRWFWRGTG